MADVRLCELGQDAYHLVSGNGFHDLASFIKAGRGVLDVITVGLKRHGKDKIFEVVRGSGNMRLITLFAHNMTHHFRPDQPRLTGEELQQLADIVADTKDPRLAHHFADAVHFRSRTEYMLSQMANVILNAGHPGYANWFCKDMITQVSCIPEYDWLCRLASEFKYKA